jgi:hypothetical protein
MQHSPDYTKTRLPPSGLLTMPFQGFEGPAGTGKTHNLIEAVTGHCEGNNLLDHQKVLSLTFMHGSRRRLDNRLNSIAALRGRSIAMTIDSFARTLWHRWRSLASFHGIGLGDFDQTCDACGQLLEYTAVANWVSRAYPIVIVDEAQELSPQRLRIIRALEGHVRLFVAADEFQCLDERLDTGPFMDWFHAGEITQLRRVRRTTRAGLINAGIALRELTAPNNGPGLRISYEFPNLMPFKIGAALYHANGSKAVLYAPGATQWAQQVISRLAEGLHSRAYNIPPLLLTQEVRPRDEIEATVRLFGNGEPFEVPEIARRIEGLHAPPRWCSDVIRTTEATERCLGKGQWTREELTLLMERKSASYRAYAGQRGVGIPVMSIHQAKNREFENVVLLWPPGVPGSDEFKARLLYNGITRAQRNCRVFVRTEALLAEPPFNFQ